MMTNPGQRAAQQAAATSNSMAQQHAYDTFARNSAYRPRGGRIGFFGVIGRLIGLVITLVIIGVAVSIILMVIHRV
jgi:hypothetical protein